MNATDKTTTIAEVVSVTDLVIFDVLWILRRLNFCKTSTILNPVCLSCIISSNNLVISSSSGFFVIIFHSSAASVWIKTGVASSEMMFLFLLNIKLDVWVLHPGSMRIMFGPSIVVLATALLPIHFSVRPVLFVTEM